MVVGEFGGVESVVGGLFGDVEVVEKADEGGDDAAPIGAVEGINGLAGKLEHFAMVNNYRIMCRFGGVLYDITMEVTRCDTCC